MLNIISSEIFKFKKSKKNIIILILMVSVIISLIINNIYAHRNYVKEIRYKREVSSNLNHRELGDMVWIRKFYDDAKRGNQYYIDFFNKNYGSLEEYEKILPEIDKKLYYFNRDQAYVTTIFRQTDNYMNPRVKEKQEDARNLIRYTATKAENLIDAFNDKSISDEYFIMNGSSIEETKQEYTLYSYLENEEINYPINVHLNTGAYLLNQNFINISSILIYLIITLFVMDVFTKEMESGTYKISYTISKSKTEIYTSKILTMLLIGIIVIMIFFISMFLVGVIQKGVGDFNLPVVMDKNIGRISFSKEVDFMAVPMIKEFILRTILFISVILMNINLIGFLSVYSDSISLIIGLESGVLILTILARLFLNPDSIIHGLNPFSYIFVSDVLLSNYNTNYIFGLILNIGLAIIFYLLSVNKFNKKDFVGAR